MSFQDLKTHLGEIHDLNMASSILEWDQETKMPLLGANARSAQLATLAKFAHERFVSGTTEKLLSSLEKETFDYDSDEAALLRLTRREFDKSSKLPSEFVAEQSRSKAISLAVWREARKTNDFKTFAPNLEQMYTLARRKADYLGFDEHPYDALLNEYEPGLSTRVVETTFADLRDQTVPLVKAIAAKGTATDYSILTRECNEQAQEAFGLEVAQAFGYDLNRGRLDRAAHPFQTAFSRDDVRMTTRYDERYFPMALFGTLHETGHALYELGTAPELARTGLAQGTSLGIHESQSRMWENLVGRSRAFWTHWYPRFVAHFPQFGDVSPEEIYKAVNRVQPSLIRVEADEITYNLHVMLRFELEKALLEGSLKVADLPEAWNAKMESYLGITPPDDARGVLQDIHWGMGLVGYFPTYTLGNILSVQLLETAKKQIGDTDAMFAKGEYAPLLGWMRENIHRHGKKFKPEELVQRATGSSVTPKPYVAYLIKKFSDIYDLNIN
jgi:carboxypeptidase Taq